MFMFLFRVFFTVGFLPRIIFSYKQSFTKIQKFVLVVVTVLTLFGSWFVIGLVYHRIIYLVYRPLCSIWTINGKFYVILVVVAILTNQLAKPNSAHPISSLSST